MKYYRDCAATPHWECNYKLMLRIGAAHPNICSTRKHKRRKVQRTETINCGLRCAAPYEPCFCQSLQILLCAAPVRNMSNKRSTQLDLNNSNHYSHHIKKNIYFSLTLKPHSLKNQYQILFFFQSLKCLFCTNKTHYHIYTKYNFNKIILVDFVA